MICTDLPIWPDVEGKTVAEEAAELRICDTRHSGRAASTLNNMTRALRQKQGLSSERVGFCHVCEDSGSPLGAQRDGSRGGQAFLNLLACW
jgi:hypothetical protein